MLVPTDAHILVWSFEHMGTCEHTHVRRWVGVGAWWAGGDVVVDSPLTYRMFPATLG